MNELFDLSGKIAIVTGASRGIGKAISIGFGKAGATVIAAARTVEDLDNTVAKINGDNGKAIRIQLDVKEEESITTMVKTAIEKFGRVDILVNNAGILRMGPSEQMSSADWTEVMTVNLKGQFLVAQAVGREMIKQGSGSIINIASVAGQFGFPMAAAYDSSKGGVILLTKALAAEWGAHGIRVNCIAPGAFATDMTADLSKSPEFADLIQRSIPMRRMGQPEELVGASIYLASNSSSYVTGHVLVVDGGWTAGL